MKNHPIFLTVAEIIEFHDLEIISAGGASGIRDMHGLESAVGAPKATFAGVHLMPLFEMAATYINSIAFNHPFVDGNKRTALASALTFLYLNGFEIEEDYDEELADIMLDLLAKKISKDDLAEHLKIKSKSIA